MKKLLISTAFLFFTVFGFAQTKIDLQFMLNFENTITWQQVDVFLTENGVQPTSGKKISEALPEAIFTVALLAEHSLSGMQDFTMQDMQEYCIDFKESAIDWSPYNHVRSYRFRAAIVEDKNIYTAAAYLEYMLLYNMLNYESKNGYNLNESARKWAQKEIDKFRFIKEEAE